MAITVATIFLSAVFSDIVSAAHVRRDIEDRHAVDMTDSLVARMHAGLMDSWYFTFTGQGCKSLCLRTWTS